MRTVAFEEPFGKTWLTKPRCISESQRQGPSQLVAIRQRSILEHIPDAFKVVQEAKTFLWVCTKCLSIDALVLLSRQKNQRKSRRQHKIILSVVARITKSFGQDFRVLIAHESPIVPLAVEPCQGAVQA